jgi:phosphatidylinositol alpha-1,6-mannosyltransferase
MKLFNRKIFLTSTKVFAITNSWPPMVSGHGRFFYQLLKNYNDKFVLAPQDDADQESKGIFRLLKYASIKNQSRLNSILQHIEIVILPLILIFMFKARPRVTLASQVLFSGLAAFIIKLVFKIPYVFIAHGEEFSIYKNNKSSLKYNLAKIISKNASCIICNTNNTKNIIEEFYSIDQSKLKIINPIVDLQESILDQDYLYSFKKEKFQERKIVLMTGRLYEERKGFDTAIEAFARVKKLFPDVVLVIIGPGTNLKLNYLVSKNNLDDDVKFLGKVDRKTLLNYYAICDIFLMPNRTLGNGDAEGFGIVFLEANMFGKPVIGGLSGGVPDAIENMISGILVNGENIEEVSDALLRLLLDKDLRESIGDSARRRVINLFNENLQSSNFKKVIQEVLN